MDDKQIAILVLSVLSALVFFLLFGVILATHCSEQHKRLRDPYIVGTFVFLCLCFLSRTLDLAFIFSLEPKHETCISITANVLPYCFFIVATIVNLNRWVHVTSTCAMIAAKSKVRSPCALCTRNCLHLLAFTVLAVMCYGVFAACFYGTRPEANASELHVAGETLEGLLQASTGIVLLGHIVLFSVLRNVLKQHFILEYNDIWFKLWLILVGAVVALIGRIVLVAFAYMVKEQYIIRPITDLQMGIILLIYVTEIIPGAVLAWSVWYSATRKQFHKRTASLLTGLNTFDGVQLTTELSDELREYVGYDDDVASRASTIGDSLTPAQLAMQYSSHNSIEEQEVSIGKMSTEVPSTLRTEQLRESKSYLNAKNLLNISPKSMKKTLSINEPI